jgi:hypothetical protein
MAIEVRIPTILRTYTAVTVLPAVAGGAGPTVAGG